ncbi:hypothetical protein COCMIDRAFT_32857 [Bipolaris oryzae ATCC 44560]|uniref:Uncharacterized protein n=1 Tax=Bipolaris oryzae ATCC 44560 TaxID=930090 RepID=W6ZIP6_COCMI|nr:uncharacterized protein COCMIDRAFT_32857 [Bipolaris oryzae ATCC 44560]EUC49848.1 hypothetical protein COCMIDRAFT_32857 [Bipolaris oryzae ATCC 44560]
MPVALTTRAVAAVAGWARHFLECHTHPPSHPVSTVSGLRAKLVSAACGPYFAISRHSTRGGRSRDAIPTPRKGQKSFLGPKPALPYDCSWLLQKFRLFFLFSSSPRPAVHPLPITHPRPLILTLPPRLRFTSLAFHPTPGQP